MSSYVDNGKISRFQGSNFLLVNGTLKKVQNWYTRAHYLVIWDRHSATVLQIARGSPKKLRTIPKTGFIVASEWAQCPG